MAKLCGDFSNATERRIVAAILACRDVGRSTSNVEVLAELRHRGLLEDCGRLADIVRNTPGVHTRAMLEEDAARIVETSNGSGADKARLGRVDVLGGGRRVDVLMAQGCEDRTPTRIVLAVNKPLSVLASRGVLVVACHDTTVQCLQSTRDATDVLCTSAPRK